MDELRARLEGALAGRYRFDRELGGGGMSRTYLADEPALARRVVVKVLPPELLEGLSVERFKREVLLAASLQHPHVVPVLATGDADGLPWFSMPFIDGESLRQRLARGAVPIGEAVAILRDVARALGYAHAHGVIHRDIKPDNVLLSGGSATVTDFGIAKAITASRTESSGTTLTQAGFALGTPAYMAPEQAEGDPGLDHRADLYAFGAMAWELLTGRHVFAGDTPARQLVAHLTEAPGDPRAQRADIPDALAALVVQCLAKAPADRPADAAALVRALEGVGGPSTGAVPTPTPRLRLGRALALWGGAALALVGSVFVAQRTVGVPSWALPSALTLALAGLPAILVTWWVERTARRAAQGLTITRTPGGTALPAGTLATLAVRASPVVSWRRTWRLGALAAALLLLAVGGYVTTRAMGIGPAASLIGAGTFAARERVVVADFRVSTDTSLGATVAEALRTDLGQSPNLAVATRASVREILQRMQRPADATVSFDVAREIATREGIKAIVDGGVDRLGTSYVLSARLVSAVDGRELATFGETARDDADLVPAVGRLSRAIREKVGESLRGIATAKALERVSTPSLAALRKYVEGMRLEEGGGDKARAMALLQEAVALDSGFAMAWRKIAVLHSYDPLGRPDEIVAASTAYRFRDRLADDERDLTEAYYHTKGPAPDPERALAAYEQLLARDSLNSTALNNSGVLWSQLRRSDKAAAFYRRAIAVPRPFSGAFTNLISELAELGDRRGIDSVLAAYRAALPASQNLWEGEAWRHWAAQDVDSLDRLFRRVLSTARSPRQLQLAGGGSAAIAMYRGRIAEGTAGAVQTTRALFGGERAGGLAALVVLDSADAVALYDGDRGRTAALLRRAVGPAMAAIAPPARPWERVAFDAALVGDAEQGRVAAAGYARDRRTASVDHVWEDALMAGMAAVATGDYDVAVSQLAAAGRRRTAPDTREAFLIALAHDRAGRADSAITWYRRATPMTGSAPGDALRLVPASWKRLGELYDAQGDAPRAIEAYETFATLWANAEAARQPVVKAARDRAAALRTKLSPG